MTEEIAILDPSKTSMRDLSIAGHIHTPTGECYKNRYGDRCRNMTEDVRRAIAHLQLVIAEKRLWPEEKKVLDAAVKVLQRFNH